ncbi:hypothetical protein G7054_g5073 [Neopestalotiopsis clavispora]|nr:hypothetical protein G7054_g5073 [Neopestalotiopsis clavispora]
MCRRRYFSCDCLLADPEVGREYPECHENRKDGWVYCESVKKGERNHPTSKQTSKEKCIETFPSAVILRPCPKCKNIQQHDWPKKIRLNMGRDNIGDEDFKTSLENWFQETDAFLAKVGSEFASTNRLASPKNMTQNLHTAHASCQCSGCVGVRPKKRSADTDDDSVSRKTQKLGPTQQKVPQQAVVPTPNRSLKETTNPCFKPVGEIQRASHQASKTCAQTSPANSQYGERDSSKTSSTSNPWSESVETALNDAALSAAVGQQGATIEQGKDVSGYYRAHLNTIQKAFSPCTPQQPPIPENRIAQTHQRAPNALNSESQGCSPLLGITTDNSQPMRGQMNPLQSNRKRKIDPVQPESAYDRAIKRIKAKQLESRHQPGYLHVSDVVPTNVGMTDHSENLYNTSFEANRMIPNDTGIYAKNNQSLGGVKVNQSAEKPAVSQLPTPESTHRTGFQETPVSRHQMMQRPVVPQVPTPKPTEHNQFQETPVGNKGMMQNQVAYSATARNSQGDVFNHPHAHIGTHSGNIISNTHSKKNSGGVHRTHKSSGVANASLGSTINNNASYENNVHHNPNSTNKPQASDMFGSSCSFLGRDTKTSDLVSLQQSVDNVWGKSSTPNYQRSHSAFHSPSMSSMTSATTIESIDEGTPDNEPHNGSATFPRTEVVPEKKVFYEDKFAENTTENYVPTANALFENECKQDALKQVEQSVPTESQISVSYGAEAACNGENSAQQLSKTFEEEMAFILEDAEKNDLSKSFTDDEFNSLLDGFFGGF